MAQQPVELILMRQLASTLVTPIVLVDPNGGLLFYNVAAEGLLGLPFDETGEMAMDWSSRWRPTDPAGQPIPTDRLPLMIALSERRAVHGNLGILGADGAQRRIAVTAFPLIAVPGALVGGLAMFWEEGA
jgi:PAS domain-containing protein